MTLSEREFVDSLWRRSRLVVAHGLGTSAQAELIHLCEIAARVKHDLSLARNALHHILEVGETRCVEIAREALGKIADGEAAAACRQDREPSSGRKRKNANV